MPNYDDFLYYIQKQAGNVYSDTPNGVIDVERLIKGNKYWKNPAHQQIRKAKKIIVSDWSLENEEARNDLHLLLSDLAKKNFELYLWQGDHILLISPYGIVRLHYSETRRRITPASSQEIYEVALKQYPNFSRDELFVLDRYWREQFIKGNKWTKDRVLRLSEIDTSVGISVKENFKKIISTENKSTPPLSYIVDDTSQYPDDSNESNINSYTDNCPIKVIKAYRKVQLQATELRELLINGYTTHEKCTINIEALKYAKIIELVGELNQEELNALLSYTPYLWSLDLQNVTGLPDELHINTPPLEGIFLPPNTNSECCNRIFKNNPKLNDLGLSIPLKQTLKLPRYIENLTTKKTAVSGSVLFSLFYQLRHLRKLTIDSCTDLEKFNVPKGYFPYLLETLVELNISSSISSRYLNAFLKGSARLRRLTLSSCTILEDKLNLKEGSLVYLETIKIDSVTINTTHLLTLLKAARKLKSIYYNGDDPEVIKLITTLIKRGATSTLIASPQLPIHDPHKHKNFTPYDESLPFQYLGINKTKNQGMIIEKLSQYLTLKKNHLNMIPKMQDGICAALVRAFSELDKKADGGWDGFINRALNWDGQLNTLSKQLQADFNRLYKHVAKSYGFWSFNSEPRYYIGEHLEFLLELETTLVLSNPWHSILVEKKSVDQWLVYDPNHNQGYQLLNKEDTLQLIGQSLGQIIYTNHSLNKPALIKDPNAFIAQGGLLALHKCANTQVLLPQLSPGINYTKGALEGLLLRDTKGIPAWVSGLKNKQLKTFTFELIQEFIIQNPHEWSVKLDNSMGCMNANKRHELITKVIHLSKKLSQQKPSTPTTGLAQPLIDTIRIKPSLKELFARQLQTWDNKPKEATTLLNYCQSCFASDGPKKRIIQTDSTEELKSLKYALHQYAHNTHRPVFYVNHPDDLICSAPYTARQGNKGLVKKGPGGPLYDFLTQNKDNAPVLIVNYEHFNSDDLVGFNGLIDKEQQADGTPLPKETLVLGLINVNKPDCYQGSDFYSRFDTLDHSPVNKAELNELIPTIKQVTEEHDTYVIDFYHGSDWKERLLGQWILNGTELIFREGELYQALASAKTIELKNGPWNDEEFQLFWQEALLTRSVDNGRLQLPQQLNVLQSEGYNWSNLNYSLELSEYNKDALVLNSSSFNELFTRYLCSNNALISQSGFIEQAANDGFTELSVYLTRELSVDDWARTLTTCTKAKIKLKLSVAPGVSLPSEMAPDFQSKAPPEPKSWDGQASNHVIIQSNDISATVATLLKENSKAQVIDISECTPSDLFLLIKGNIQDDPSEFFLHRAPLLS